MTNSFSVRVLQNALDFHTKELRGVQTVIATLRSQLQGRCDHRVTKKYHWEHDNGYGIQTEKIGKRCEYCLWVDLWGDGHFIDPKELII